MLADTSVWIDHFRHGNTRLRDELEAGEVVTHEFVIGELACGNLRNRSEILGLITSLPSVTTVPHDEVLELVTRRKLMGRGLGWIDMHLLAASVVAGIPLFTLDKRLARFSSRFWRQTEAARSIANGVLRPNTVLPIPRRLRQHFRSNAVSRCAT